MVKHARFVTALALLAGCSSGGGGGGKAPPDTTPPTVILVMPPDASAGVLPGTLLEATFDEPLDPGSVTTATFAVEVGGAPVAGATSTAGAVARFTPAAPLPELALVTARLTTAVRDLAGNRLAAPFAWSFTVADVTPPAVLGVAPAAGSVEVEPHAVVTVDFSEPVRDSAATTAAVTLSAPGGAQVPATVTVSGATVRLTPSAPLGWGTAYAVAVGVGVTDLAGNPLPAPVTSSFTTRPQPGALDASFAASGVARLDLGGVGDTARALAIRASDGGIALGAQTDGLGGARLIRLLADGDLDPSFGTTGVAAPGPAFACASGVGFQSTGRLVAVMGEGGGATNTFTTARLDDAGLLDPTFGASGVARPDLATVRPDLGGAFNGCSTRMAVQPDDRIVLAGERSTTTGLLKPIMTVVRLTAGGDLDPSFGTSGVVALDGPDFRSTSWAVALQPDGKIIVGGWSYWDGEGAFDAVVVRLDAGGQPDPSFGTTGVARIHAGPAGSNDRVVGVGVDGVGRILVAVDSYAAGGYRAFLARLDASGALDPSFAFGGITMTFGGPAWGGLVVQPDGKAVVAGGAGAGLAVARLGPTGALDPVFGAGGVATHANGPFPFATALQPDGSIVVVGEVGSAKDVGLARLRP